MLDETGAHHDFRLVRPNERFIGAGDGLDVATQSFDEGETVPDAAATGPIVGEEVAAIISGVFQLTVIGDESYVLKTGEAIIIPRGFRREWRCLSGGTLFRTVTRNEVRSHHPHAL